MIPCNHKDIKPKHPEMLNGNSYAGGLILRGKLHGFSISGIKYIKKENLFSNWNLIM